VLHLLAFQVIAEAFVQKKKKKKKEEEEGG